ncbi:hypothetical protein L2E82_19338 [Cichorium intybus]|uniref:Uncharacterized protein n=1 Tax=Cichorium intybus TaxID=13427 RepID=A0ACB9FCA6_CICIN|nr:hypothetical protein L2E82_19338 [Cichorium intybus]
MHVEVSPGSCDCLLYYILGMFDIACMCPCIVMLKYNSNGTIFAIYKMVTSNFIQPLLYIDDIIDLITKFFRPLKIPSLISLPVSIAGKLSLIRTFLGLLRTRDSLE